MPVARLALALAAALVTAAVLIPAASAVPAYYEVEYDVDLTTTVTWSISKADVDDYPKRTDELSGKATFTSRLESVAFRNGTLLNPFLLGPSGEPAVTGSGKSTLITWDAANKREIVSRDTCTAQGYNPGTTRLQRAAQQPNPDEERLAVRFSDSLLMSFACGKHGDAGSADLASNGRAFPEQAMDATFTLPHEAIGMGKIIQNVSAPAANQSPAFCPGQDNPVTTACSYTWSSQLVFTKTSEYQYMGDDDAPPPPTGTGVDPRAEAISKAVEQYGKDVPVDPRADAISKAVEQYGREPARDVRAEIISWAVEQYGKSVDLELGCSNGCTGTAVITPGPGSPSGARPRAFMATAAARRAVATIRFKVQAGAPRKVHLKLPARARKALRKAGGGRLVLTLKPRKGGPTVRRTLSVKL